MKRGLLGAAAPGRNAGPRRPLGVGARPLNFTVRRTSVTALPRIRRLAKWGRKSLLNFIVLSEIIAAPLTFLVLCLENYSEGTLTLAWAFWLLEIAVITGVVIAVPTWFLFVGRRVQPPRFNADGTPQPRPPNNRWRGP